jgi:hypothetical protein
LKHGGIAVISVPLNEGIKRSILDVSKNDLENMDYESIKKKYSIQHWHLTSFSEKFLTSALEDNGFKIIQTEFTNNYTPLFKNKKIYDIIYLIMSKAKINRHHIAEKLFNIIIFLVYSKKKTIRHIIVCAKKNHKKGSNIGKKG